MSLAGALPFSMLCATVLGTARRIANAHGATFVLRDGDNCFYVDEDAIAPLWRGQRFPIDTCISGWAMLHDEVAVVPDVADDPRLPVEAYRPTFVKSLVMVPMGTPAVGAVGVYWAQPNPPVSDDVVARLSQLACEAGDTLRRLGIANAPWAPNFALGLTTPDTTLSAQSSR